MPPAVPESLPIPSLTPVLLDDNNPTINNDNINKNLIPSEYLNPRPWATSKSSSLYKIDAWGAPYFFANSKGHMAVRPHGALTKPSEEIDMMKVVEQLLRPKNCGGLGLHTPAIIRFPHILKHRLESLQSAFNSAIKLQDFRGCFRGVYPVKCNQDRYVVENIVRYGEPYGFGLEAGSKPELLLAMSALSKGSPDALLICNGYKDADYVQLALLARKMGFDCVIVLEQAEEVDLVLHMSKRLGIEPVIGLRAKLNTKHAGHFGDTSGEKSKFGLTCTEIVRVVNKLQSAGKLECLQLLHFHIGSQIPSLSILNDGVSEATHIYCELALMGAGMKIIDIGGGLGIDYDGSSSPQSDMSVGYTMEEYALEVVQAVKNACDRKGVKQPTLCSESGRALVSHHSVLVFDVLHSQVKHMGLGLGKGVPLDLDGLPDGMRMQHARLSDFVRACDYESAFECAKRLKHGCTELFKLGQFSLSLLASVNNIYDVLSASVADESRRLPSKWYPEFSLDKEERDQYHDAIYHVNLSIFKSMPDTWAIGQLFPIVPLHRLEEEPNVRAVLSDLTCDSDGKITTFIGRDTKGRNLNYLKVHRLQDKKPYYMGMFLGGAYQEALGSLHNLFGTPNVVDACKVFGTKCLKVTKISDGQTAVDVLKLMQYEPASMLEGIKTQITRSLNYDDEACAALINTLACSFGSSTYLTTNHNAPPCRKGMRRTELRNWC